MAFSRAGTVPFKAKITCSNDSIFGFMSETVISISSLQYTCRAGGCFFVGMSQHLNNDWIS